MKPIFIPGAGMFLPAEVCADLRHGAVRDLRKAQRAQASVAPDIVAAVGLMDDIGAAWANRQVSNISPDVSLLDPQRCEPVKWISVPESATELNVSEQATRRLLERGTLHGERGSRTWRVCAASVAARKEGSKCQH